MGAPVHLYRHFDAAGRLLYVGISIYPTLRLAQHRRQTWWREVSRVETTAFDTRDEAIFAEAEAIRTEDPVYNQVVPKPRMRPERAVNGHIAPRREATAIALIHPDGKTLGISFPDFPGVVATGRTPEEAIRKGSEALSFHVAGMDEDGEHLPFLRDLDELQADPDFLDDQAGAVLTLVPFDLPTKSVRINISIDESLLGAVDRGAKAEGKSRSAFLTEAALAKLRA